MLPRDTPANELLKGTQGRSVFRSDKTDSVTHSFRSTGPANAMNVILGMRRKVKVHHVRDPFDINPTSGDIRGYKNANRPRLEITESANALIL